MASYLIDSHSHLDLFPNFIQILQKCDSVDIELITVTNAPSVWQTNRALSGKYPRIHAALGFHPQLTKERYREIDLFEKYLNQARFVGEIGLDGSKEIVHTFETQKEIFVRILQCCASEGNKVLSVHSRKASREVIEIIAKYLPKQKGKTILHWFTGTKTEVAEAVKLGCYFSINNCMLINKKGRALLDMIPPERVVTETDAPFINNLGYPFNIEQTVKSLANFWALPIISTKDLIYKNFIDLTTHESYDR